jgi:hypothetical protein
MNMKNALSISINEFPPGEIRDKREISDTISMDPTVHKDSILYAIGTLEIVIEKLKLLLADEPN